MLTMNNDTYSCMKWNSDSIMYQIKHGVLINGVFNNVNSWYPLLHSVRWPSPYACPGKPVEMSCPTPEFDGTWNVSLNAPLLQGMDSSEH